MSSVSIADAKAHLSELVERAARGETVRITRRGKPIAQIVALEGPRKPIDVRAVRAMVAIMPRQKESARKVIRHMRDAARY